MKLNFWSMCTALFTLFLAHFALSSPEFAQVSTGSISGTVVDAQSALTLLPPGTYHLSVSKTGFRKLDMDDVPVRVGADTGLATLISRHSRKSGSRHARPHRSWCR
jgi:hypothetical protein